MKKALLLLFILILTLGAFKFGLTDYLNFAYIKENSNQLLSYYAQKPWVIIGGFFTLYILVTALSLPGAVILTLAGGVIFGLGQGVLIVSFASTMGATMAFLVARFLFQDIFKSKYREKFTSINNGLKKDGDLYLFGLRLVPIFPFFLINILMGLTNYKTWKFFLVSQIGMLPGTIVYINAGTQIARLKSASGILTPSFLISFALLGLVPLIFKFFLSVIKKRKVYKGWNKPKSFDYDLVVIGAGSGGLVSSYIGATVNAKVALIEKHKMGGDCLNTGCVPSKAIIKSAKVANIIKHSEKYGIRIENSEIKFDEVMSRIRKVIKKIEPHDSVERYSKLGVHCLNGEAEVVSPWEVKVNGKILSARNLIIATGAGPSMPPIAGLLDSKYLTSDTIWGLKELPKKLVVLGGGPIGIELAQAFKRLGSEVVVVEAGARILSKEDEDVSRIVVKKLQDDGVKLFTGHKAIKFIKKDGKEILIAQNETNEVEVEFNYCLVAVGRKANTKIPGLDKLNLTIAPAGTFEHDEYMRTKFPNIFVVGDCAGPYQFTHTASHQAWYAAVNALFAPLASFKADYRVVPWCTFTEPELARVGVSEDEAKEQGLEYEIIKYDLSDLDRAITEDEDYGLIKVIIAKGSDQILGASIVSTRASELLAEFTLAMKYKIGMNKILGTIHAYPTFPEAIKYAAGEWKRAHKPERILVCLKKFHTWRRG